MSETSEKFNQVAAALEAFALLEGGELFQDGTYEEVSLAKNFSGRGVVGRSHFEFTASREIEDKTGVAVGVNYILHQGTTKVLSALPEEVMIYAELDESDIEPEDEMCVNDCITYDLSPHHRSIEIARASTFILDETVVYSAPLVGGQLLFEPTAFESLEPIMTTSESGLTVIEYTKPGLVTAVMNAQQATDSFEAIIEALEEESDKLDETLESMLGIMAVLHITQR
jgi:hypothetical protein